MKLYRDTLPATTITLGKNWKNNFSDIFLNSGTSSQKGMSPRYPLAVLLHVSYAAPMNCSIEQNCQEEECEALGDCGVSVLYQ